MTPTQAPAPFARPPRCVAVVGASPRRFFARWSVANLLAHGFAGRILLVHPTETELFGLPVHPSIEALPETPELALVALGAPACAGAVAALRSIGCTTIVVLSDGFAETGTPEGAALQDELARAAGGTTLIGPNCMGVADLPAQLVAIGGPVPADLAPGPVSVVSHSGGLVATVLSGLAAEATGADLCLSIGNAAAFSLADGLAACARRPRTEVVAAYVEGVGSDAGPVADALGELAATGRRVVAVIPGSSQEGRRLVESHTARLSGSHALAVSLFEQHGALVVADLETLVRVAALAPVIGRRRGGVAVVTGSGGAASLVADAARSEGMALATYSAQTAASLRRLVPASGTVGNPTDLSGGQTDTAAVLSAVASDPGVGAVLVPFPAPFPDGSPERASHAEYIEAAARATAASRCALVVVSMVPQTMPEWTSALRTRPQVAVTQGLTVTARALGLLLSGGHAVAPSIASAPAPAPAADLRFLSEAEGRALLVSAGVAVVPGRWCGPDGDPVATAGDVGFPLVVKAVLPGVAHKQAVGAVSGPVGDVAAALAACRAISARCDAAGVAIDGFLFEQLARGPELLVGLRRDPAYGPHLTLGIGGRLAETGIGAATVLLRAASGSWEALFERAGVARVVDATGMRGALAGYLSDLADAFVAGPLAGFETVEINPLFLSDELGVVAADVLVERPG